MDLKDLPIVCISLDRRTDRWKNVQVAAAAANLTVSRVSAVDASEFVPHKHPAVSLATAHNIYYKMRRSHYEIDAGGAVGASLSHFKVWKQLLDSSAPAMIIFEDDIHIPPDLKMRLEKILAELPDEWDILQLQRTEFGKGMTGCKAIKGEEPWQLCTSLMGAWSYIVSRRGAKRLLEKAYPIELHVDAYMAYMCRMGHCKMIWHPLIDLVPADSGSDIGHGSCTICNIPTNMEKYGVIAMPLRSIFGIMVMAAVAGGFLSLTLTKCKIR
jgi:glycosyl transferase family 25